MTTATLRNLKATDLLSGEELAYRKVGLLLEQMAQRLEVAEAVNQKLEILLHLKSQTLTADWDDWKMISQRQVSKALGLNIEFIKHCVDTGFFVAQDYIDRENDKETRIRLRWGQVKEAILKFEKVSLKMTQDL